MIKVSAFFLTILVMASCASDRGRKNIALGEVVINGGIHHDKQWDDKLVFKRTSWFQESSMEYDIMIHKLDKTSPFAAWLEADKSYFDKCHDFYISLIYADPLATHLTKAFLVDQMDKLGLDDKSIPSFEANLKAHDNYEDWRLNQYRIVGFCKPEPPTRDLVISVPGFKSTRI